MVHNAPFKKFLVHRVSQLLKSSLGSWNIEWYGVKMGHWYSRLFFVVGEFISYAEFETLLSKKENQIKK